MTLDLYSPGTSLLHRLSPGAKIVVLMLAGTGLFLVESMVLSALVLLLVAALYPAAGLGGKTLLNQVLPIWWILAFIVLAQGLFNSWVPAFFWRCA